MSHIKSKSCKDQTIEWMIERRAIVLDEIGYMLAGVAFFFVGYAVAAGF